MNLLPSFRLKTFPQWLGLLLVSGYLLTACEESKNADVADDPYTVHIVRLDQIMADCIKTMQASPDDDNQAIFKEYLSDYQDFFYEFLGMDYYVRVGRLTQAAADSLTVMQWTRLLEDSAMFALADTISQLYPADYDFDAILMPPLKRFHKAFPEIAVDTLFTHLNGYNPGATPAELDQFTSPQGILSIGLHYFMGANNANYPPQVPAFIRRRFVPEMMDVQMMHFISEGVVAPYPDNQNPSLLDAMIREGIKQYFVQQMLPYTPDSMRLQYTSAQMEWANYFEGRIYKELIDKLFETKFNYQQTYIGEKPYTTTLVRESAPRVGIYSGYQIVKSYMDRNSDVSLQELVERTDYETIFKQAKYRPESR